MASLRHAVCLALMTLPGTAWAEAACAPDRLDLRWDGGQESFAVELADTPDERAQGLMFRTEMAPASGMLFVYEVPRRVQFWMKNTLIPLDMVFVNEAMMVVGVVENAEPLTLSSRSVGVPSRYVVEVPGGFAKKASIAAGDRMRMERVAGF